jgi:hypothetical protein
LTCLRLLYVHKSVDSLEPWIHFFPKLKHLTIDVVTVRDVFNPVRASALKALPLALEHLELNGWTMRHDGAPCRIHWRITEILN